MTSLGIGFELNPKTLGFAPAQTRAKGLRPLDTGFPLALAWTLSRPFRLLGKEMVSLSCGEPPA